MADFRTSNNFPGSVDVFEDRVDGQDIVFSKDLNDLADSVVDTQTEVLLVKDGYETIASDYLVHKADTSNPHSVTYTQVGAEPANANIQSHISSTSNPHSVTASNVGLGSSDDVTFASVTGAIITNSIAHTTGPLNIGVDGAPAVINIGTGTGATTINVGTALDTVSIAGNLQVTGTTTTVNADNLNIADQVINLNVGGDATTAKTAAIVVEDGLSLSINALGTNWVSSGGMEFSGGSISGTILGSPTWSGAHEFQAGTSIGASTGGATLTHWLRAGPGTSEYTALRIGRTDSDTRYHAIKSKQTSGAANSYLTFSIHDGAGTSPFDTTVDVMTLRSDAITLAKPVTVTSTVTIDDGTNGRITLGGNTTSNWIYSTTTGFGTYEDLNFRAAAYSFKQDATTEIANFSSSLITLAKPVYQSGAGTNGINHFKFGAAFSGVLATKYSSGGVVLTSNAQSASTTADSWQSISTGTNVGSVAQYMGINSVSTNAWELRARTTATTTATAGFATYFNTPIIAATYAGAVTIGPASGGVTHTVNGALVLDYAGAPLSNGLNTGNKISATFTTALGNVDYFTGGVAGQIFIVSGSSAGASVTFRHNTGATGQKFLLPGGASHTITGGYGGAIFVCDGTFWILVGHTN